MRIFQNIDVVLSYQNFGSTWCCILRGSSENIELVFNALYNWKATNGEFQFFDHAQTVAVFWSSEEKLARCLYRIRINSAAYRYLGKHANWNFVHGQMAELRKHHEAFLNFNDVYFGDCYGVGSAVAEKPDTDFKDSVIAYGHADKKI